MKTIVSRCLVVGVLSLGASVGTSYAAASATQVVALTRAEMKADRAGMIVRIFSNNPTRPAGSACALPKDAWDSLLNAIEAGNYDLVLALTGHETPGQRPENKFYGDDTTRGGRALASIAAYHHAEAQRAVGRLNWRG